MLRKAFIELNKIHLARAMRILITGDTGFIGKNLSRFLKDLDVKIKSFSRSSRKDILDLEKVFQDTKDVDLVYHLAAYANPAESLRYPIEAFQVNVMGTLNILEACRKHGFSLIYVSTCEIYGDSQEPIKEDHPIRPPNPYAASKAAADRACYCYHKAYGIDVKILRLFNPYGPYQQLTKIIPVFYSQAIRNMPITVYGDGTDTRDYTYIEDVIRALWLARNLKGGEVVNVCTGIATTSLQVAKLIIELTDSQSEIRFVDYPKLFGGIRKQVGCPDKIKQILGWKPEYTLKQGLIKTIEWLQTVFEQARKSPQNP